MIYRRPISIVTTSVALSTTIFTQAVSGNETLLRDFDYTVEGMSAQLQCADNSGKLTVSVLTLGILLVNQNTSNPSTDFDILPNMPDVRGVIPIVTAAGAVNVFSAAHALPGQYVYQAGLVGAGGYPVGALRAFVQCVVQNTDGAAAHSFSVQGTMVWKVTPSKQHTT